MESTTKTTTATVRIALSFAYSTFEVSQQLENPGGISNEEIGNSIINTQALAEQALNAYKATYQSETKATDKRKPQYSSESIEEIEKLPMYTDVIKQNRENETKKPLKSIRNGNN